MKQRWVLYLLIGVVFGVFDFYYHGFISKFFIREQPFGLIRKIVWLVLSIGVWLVPVIYISLYETKISHSRLKSALVGSLIWSLAIISYYLTNVVQLAFVGLQTRPELHITNHKTPFFWDNWKSVFLHDIILGGIVEWMFIALIGGLLIGFFTSFIFLHFR